MKGKGATDITLVAVAAYVAGVPLAGPALAGVFLFRTVKPLLSVSPGIVLSLTRSEAGTDTVDGFGAQGTGVSVCQPVIRL